MTQATFVFTGKERDTESELDYFGPDSIALRWGAWCAPIRPNCAPASFSQLQTPVECT